MSPESAPETRFITDRMLGTLSRDLPFMGFNTVSAHGFAGGNAKEDTLLLNLAARENRILLTRDFELALRGKDQAILIKSDEVMEQVQQLIDRGLIVRRLMMTRCSLCNTELRRQPEGRYRVRSMLPTTRTGCCSSGAIGAANSTGTVRTGSIFLKELSRN